MMATYGARAEVIRVLNQMVQEGAISGFQTLHFGKADTGEDPTVVVTPSAPLDPAEARALAGKIRGTLSLLIGEVVVTVQHHQPRR